MYYHTSSPRTNTDLPITGTDLVTKKIISSYRTDTGTRYLIRKDYYQLVQRMIRMEKRQTMDDAKNTQSPFTDFATQSPLATDSEDDDSIEQATIPKEIQDTTPTNASQPPAETSRPDPDENDDSTINTEVTKIAEEVETNLTKAMLAINEQTNDVIPDEDKLTSIIQSVFASELSTVLKRLETQESSFKTEISTRLKRIEKKEYDLDQVTKKCKALNAKLHQSIDSVVTLHQTLTQTTDKLMNKYNYLTRTVEEIKNEITK